MEQAFHIRLRHDDVGRSREIAERCGKRGRKRRKALKGRRGGEGIEAAKEPDGGKS